MTMCATPSAAQSSVEAGDNVCAGVPPRLTPWRPTGVPLGVLAADEPGDIGAPSRPSATPLFLFPFFFFPMINYHTRTHTVSWFRLAAKSPTCGHGCVQLVPLAHPLWWPCVLLVHLPDLGDLG
jgi:hypothetical protein